MATLYFDDTNDWINGTGQGAMNGTITFALLLRWAGGFGGLIYSKGSGGTIGRGVYLDTGGHPSLHTAGAFSDPTGLDLANTTDWYILVVTKTLGSSTPRFHVKNITTGTAWLHANGDSAQSNPSESATGGSVEIGRYSPSSWYANGDMALVAWWDGTVLTDIQAETLAANLRTSDWHALAPNSLTELTSITPVDIEGLETWTLNGPALTGTDPPGWTFDGVGEPTEPEVFIRASTGWIGLSGAGSGEPGPEGPAGPTGATGPTGPQGPPGLNNGVYSDLWVWTTKTADANTSGQIGVNQTTWAAATVLNLNERTKDNRDISTLLFPRIVAGDQFYLQHKTDATRYAYYTVSGTPTDNGTWWSIPVTFTSGGGSVPGGSTDTNVSLLKLGISANSVPVQDEGTDLTTRARLNFVGAGVTATDDSGNDRTLVTIPGGGGSLTVQDEGTGLTARSTLNFVGAGVTAADDAANTRTVVTIPGGGSSSAWAPTQIETFDSLSAFTFDAGNASQFTLAGGTATPNTTAEKILYVPSVNVTEGKAMIRFIVSTGNPDVALIFRRIDGNNFLMVLLFTNPGANFAIYKRDGGSYSAFVSTTGAALVNGRTYWLVARWLGNRLRGELWDVDPRKAQQLRGPMPFTSWPLLDREYTLTSGDATKFGAVNGAVGLRFSPAAATGQEGLDELTYGPATTPTSTSDF